MEDRCNVSILSMICDNTSMGILNTLQLVMIEKHDKPLNRELL